MTNITADQHQSAPPVVAPARITLGCYLAAIGAAVAGLVLTVVDQTVLHGLDQHLHAMYDPVGKSAQPTPLYVYLYSVGLLGVLSGLLCLRLLRRGSTRSRGWGVTIVIVALLVVAPLFLQEYGQQVIPLQLSIFAAAAWLFGLVGVLAHPRRRRS